MVMKDETVLKNVQRAMEAAGVLGTRNEEVIIRMMGDEYTHVDMHGMMFEKKFLKTPKPHYELRQVGK